MYGFSLWMGVALSASLATGALAQTPQPFPRPGDPARPQPSAPPPQTPRPGLKVLPPQTPPPAPAPVADAAAEPAEPTQETLGLPVYPGSHFITSYDAGKGQRFYLFGTITDFAQIVTYYRNVLRQRGDQIFDLPAIHMFEVGRFREDSMAFPPGVTVKDYAWGGSEGYINPKPGGQPARFRTVIQIVPAPAGADAGR
jgi:hypothetical protein